ncbi:hypothetical protein [Pyrococcus furiosus]|nr:hypothetical protein [Pyrococcus furiosus]
MLLMFLAVSTTTTKAGSLEPYLLDRDVKKGGEVSSVDISISVSGGSINFNLKVSYSGKHGFGAGAALYGYYNPETNEWAGFGRWMNYETKDYTTPVIPITKIRYRVNMYWKGDIKRERIATGDYKVYTIYHLTAIRHTERPGERWDKDEVLINGNFRLSGLITAPKIQSSPIEDKEGMKL